MSDDAKSYIQHLDKFFQDNVFWGRSKTIQNARKHPELQYVEKTYIGERYDNLYTQQRHRQVNNKRHRPNKTDAPSIGYLQMDFADFRSLGPTNNPYLLVIIDKYSRKIWLNAFPNRSQKNIILFLKTFIPQWKTHYMDPYPNDQPALRRIKTITTDSEFHNDTMVNFLAKHDIKLYSSKPNDKGATALVERVIQTIRKMIGRWLTANNSQDWNVVITSNDLERVYNNTKHRTVGISPEWSFTHLDKFQKLDKNQRELYSQWQEDPENFDDTSTFPEYIPIGTLVRLKIKYSPFFRKSNKVRWSHEVYRVHQRDGNRYIVTSVDTGEIKLRKRPNAEGQDTEINIRGDIPEKYAASDLLVIKRMPKNPPETDPTQAQIDYREANRRKNTSSKKVVDPIVDFSIDPNDKDPTVDTSGYDPGLEKTYEDNYLNRFDVPDPFSSDRFTRNNNNNMLNIDDMSEIDVLDLRQERVQRERDLADQGDSDLASYAPSSDDEPEQEPIHPELKNLNEQEVIEMMQKTGITDRSFLFGLNVDFNIEVWNALKKYKNSDKSVRKQKIKQIGYKYYNKRSVDYIITNIMQTFDMLGRFGFADSVHDVLNNDNISNEPDNISNMMQAQPPKRPYIQTYTNSAGKVMRGNSRIDDDFIAKWQKKHPGKTFPRFLRHAFRGNLRPPPAPQPPLAPQSQQIQNSQGRMFNYTFSQPINQQPIRPMRRAVRRPKKKQNKQDKK